MVNQGDTFTTLFYLDKDGYVLDGTETIKFSIKEKLEDAAAVLNWPAVWTGSIMSYRLMDRQQICAN